MNYTNREPMDERVSEAIFSVHVVCAPSARALFEGKEEEEVKLTAMLAPSAATVQGFQAEQELFVLPAQGYFVRSGMRSLRQQIAGFGVFIRLVGSGIVLLKGHERPATFGAFPLRQQLDRRIAP